MKIGILTFHCAHNYGAVLQCYATQEFLHSKGYDVEVINYRPKYLLSPYKLFTIWRFLSKNPIRIIKAIFEEFRLFPIRLQRYKGFDRFINNRLNLSHKVSNVSELSKYDIIIVGSDQIWNPKITCGFDDVYFCNYPFAKGNRRYISYAASMECKTLDSDSQSYLCRNLNNFDSISVREIELLNILKTITDKPVYHVLDPTLMVSPQLWNQLPLTITEERYILVYQVRKNNNTIRIAEHIASQLGIKIKILVAWLQPQLRYTDQSASPSKFVEYIRNASCVITTSFHGTAFSLIFNKPFYTICLNDGADTRSLSLLKSVGLENRMINVNATPVFSEIDYSQVNSKLEEMRFFSQKYILDSIENE